MSAASLLQPGRGGGERHPRPQRQKSCIRREVDRISPKFLPAPACFVDLQGPCVLETKERLPTGLGSPCPGVRDPLQPFPAGSGLGDAENQNQTPIPTPHMGS